MSERRRTFSPPSTGNPDLDAWARWTADALNALPAFSLFSTLDGPNESAITASPPTLGFEVGSSATTRLWLKTSSGTTGWIAIL